MLLSTLISAFVFSRCLVIIRSYPFFISAFLRLICSILSLFITLFLPLLSQTSSCSTIHESVPSSEPYCENIYSTTPYQGTGLISNSSVFSIFYSSFILFLSLVGPQLTLPPILCFMILLKFIFFLCCF